MLLRISISLLLLLFMSQALGSASSSPADTTNTALRNTVLLPLQQICDDLASMVSQGSHDGSHLTDIGCTAGGTILAKDCSELYKAGNIESGVYTIYILNAGHMIPISVFCDMETDGGGWLVFQRRQDGSVDFYRGWVRYIEGFGNITGEFWLGNELLHLLAGRKHQQLRVDLRDHEGHTSFAKYEHFDVGGEKSKFVLTVNGYSGTAGDGMAFQNHQQFSTKDQDNDNTGGNCATSHKGAWWYNSCHKSNLNGLYATTGSHNMTEYGDYVNWYYWRGHTYSLKFTEMKIRPEDH